MIELTGVLLAAAVGLGLARASGLPSVPFLLLAGLALGALQPGRPEAVDQMLLLGLSVLMFAAGIELSPDRVGRHWKPALQVGLFQFAVLGALGGGLAVLIGLPTAGALYVGVATAASSTLVVVRLLALRGELAEPMGRIILGVLLLQDLLVILLIPLLEHSREGWGSAAVGLAAMVALLALAVACQRWIFPRIILARQSEDEGLVMTVLAVLFLFLGLAWAMGLPPVAGAFLGGFSLSRFPVSGVVRGQVGSLWDFFNAVFFTALGALVEVPSPRVLLQAFLLTGLLAGVTPVLVAVVAERAGLSARRSIEAGLLLAQTSEFSLVLGLHGVAVGELGAQGFSLIVLTTAVSMLLTPILTLPEATRKLMYLHPSRRRVPPSRPRPGRVILLGCGDTGLRLLEHLDPEEVVAVDHDPAIVAHLTDRGVHCYRAEGVDRALLERVGARQARVVVSTMTRVEDNLKLIRMLAPVPVLVRVFEAEPAARLEAAGGFPILHSEAAAVEFLAMLRQELPHLSSADRPKGESE